LGFIQRRTRPSIIGYAGLLQAIANAIKALAKPLTIPNKSVNCLPLFLLNNFILLNKFLYLLMKVVVALTAAGIILVLVWAMFHLI